MKMRRNMIWAASLLALALWVVPAGAVFAQETAPQPVGSVNADDANNGHGSQHNSDDWIDIQNALSGSGNQSAEVSGAANTGSGIQDNAESSAEDWHSLDNANAGNGAQVINSANSNGADRDSDDVVVDLGHMPSVGSAALESSVTGNSVKVSEMGAEGNSSMLISDGSGFDSLYGVSAVASSSGANSSQNVAVNVTAEVGVAQ